MFSRSFGSKRTLITEQNPHNPLSFDYGYNSDPIKGEILIAGKETALNAHKLSDIAAWLYQDDYKPFISNDNPDILYYIKFVDEHELFLGSNDQGYITLSFISNAPWAWGREFEYTVDLRKTGETEIIIDNISNEKNYNGLFVSIEYYRYNNEPYTICNLRNTKIDNAFILDDLYIENKKIDKYSILDGETIQIHMGYQDVVSDNPLLPSRMINCNRKWVNLLYGENTLRLTGHGIFTIKCQFPLIV